MTGGGEQGGRVANVFDQQVVPVVPWRAGMVSIDRDLPRFHKKEEPKGESKRGAASLAGASLQFLYCKQAKANPHWLEQETRQAE